MAFYARAKQDRSGREARERQHAIEQSKGLSTQLEAAENGLPPCLYEEKQKVAFEGNENSKQVTSLWPTPGAPRRLLPPGFHRAAGALPVLE